MLCSMKSIISFAYCSIDKTSSVSSGITPFICPSNLAMFIKIGSMPTTILKSIGESGSPCLTPLIV
jgi:hypothetical protein